MTSMRSLFAAAAAAAVGALAPSAWAQAPTQLPPAQAPSPQAAPAQAPPAQPAPGASAAGAATIPPASTPYRQITPAGDILSTLQASGEFTIFVKAINATNLAQIVRSHPNITVFAPTDAAFNSLPGGTLNALMNNVPALQKLVTYHIIGERLSSSQIIGHAATSIQTVANVPVGLDGASGAVKVNGATVLQADVPASNGVIFVINQVLQPSGAPPVPSAPAPSAGPGRG